MGPKTTYFHVRLIYPTVFEIRGFEKSQKTPPPLIWENIGPHCAFQWRLDSQLRQIFWTYFDPIKDFFETASPWQTVNKNRFLQRSQKPLEILKKKMYKVKYVGPHFLHRCNSVCFSLFLMVSEIRSQRITNIIPIPKLWVNFGLIVLAWGRSWFEVNWNILRNFHSNWSTCS